jgi:hypothetical protein
MIGLDQNEFLSKSFIFWDIPPCSPLKSTDVSEEKFSSISETSVEFQRITRRYIPEDRRIHNYRCGNFKSYEFLFGRDSNRVKSKYSFSNMYTNIFG